MQKNQRIKCNLLKIKIYSLRYLALPIVKKVNKKNIIKIDENGKITIKHQLLRSMSTRSERGQGSSSTN